jgi:hypothetical protein
MTNPEPKTPSDPLTNLWKIARKWLAEAIAAFGPPEAIAQMLARWARRAVELRLRALETLLMQLLLIEAAKFESQRGPGAPAALPRGETEDARPAPAADPARAETWRVRFMLCIPPDPETRPDPNRGPRIRSLGQPFLVRDIFAERAKQAMLARMARMRAVRGATHERERARAEKLARRFEALRRALEDPSPRIRQLKRKLLALAEHAHAAALRIARLEPPEGQLILFVYHHARDMACAAIPAAIAPSPNSS